jgi:hypothetical protein
MDFSVSYVGQDARLTAKGFKRATCFVRID